MVVIGRELGRAVFPQVGALGAAGLGGGRPTISHYRVHQAEEVDLILETGDGRVVGIEVKASATVTARDARHLMTLSDKLGDRFAGGLLLHTGRASAPFGERVTAAPLDIIWTG